MSEEIAKTSALSMSAGINRAALKDSDRLTLYETALRTLQEAAVGYIHPERAVSAEELADLVLAVVDDGELVRAMNGGADNQDAPLSPTEASVPPAKP